MITSCTGFFLRLVMCFQADTQRSSTGLAVFARASTATVAAILTPGPPELLPGSFVDGATEASLRVWRLKALKYALRPPGGGTWLALLEVILAEGEGLEDVDVVAVLTYLVQSQAGLAEEVIRVVLARVMPARKEEIMATWRQRYVNEGLQQGQQGRVEGERAGRAKTLLRLLSDAEERIRSADRERLDVWVEHSIAAPTLATCWEHDTDRQYRGIVRGICGILGRLCSCNLPRQDVSPSSNSSNDPGNSDLATGCLPVGMGSATV
ncbi:MAG: hypothetical protein FD153_2095 [Rhodospirillaceae bacterium]|nr:MAG: hypothetical protein FD153_2095 [Rhodospirillaceae bacterium]